MEHLDNELRAMQKEGSPMSGKYYWTPAKRDLTVDEVIQGLEVEDEREKAALRKFLAREQQIDWQKWRRCLASVGLILLSIACFFAGYWIGAR